MKYLLIAALLAFTVVSCGDDEEKETKEKKEVVLSSDKDKWSYALGFEAGAPLMSAENPNKAQFVKYKADIVAGFKEGYRELAPDKQQQCIQTIQNMMGGAQGATFNESYAKEGCNCIGLLTAGDSYMRYTQIGASEFIDIEKFEAGFSDGVNEAKKKVADAERETLLTALDQKITDANATKYSGNKTAGEEFLAENANKPGVKVTESGLQYEVLKAGSGKMPALNSQVTVHYTGMLTDGTVFESSVENGMPATFGVGGVIKGWTEALLMMKKGAKYKLYIPQELAYGVNPRPGGMIEPYMALIFEVELLEINEQTPPPATMPMR
ncbi:MAG: FKBP-type peptidyl-prolyl cis-trans isomerase N-terminal domain-containing protein [Crocinitomicaceae bacterium]